jgi:2'-5' RNA ligase
MRLFVAVLPPEDIADALAAAVAPLHRLPGADRMRWTAREGRHLTLSFFGEVPEDVRPDLDERLARAARRCEPFPLRLEGGGHFGGRSLWAGAGGALPELRRLAQRVLAAGRRAGVGQEEDRAYRPHLTVARTPGPSKGAAVDLRPYVEALADFESAAWQIADVGLVLSRLPDGRTPGEQPHYQTLARYPLGRGR